MIAGIFISNCVLIVFYIINNDTIFRTFELIE